MDDLINKIKFLKNKNKILDIFNYIINENINYNYNQRGMIIYYNELSKQHINKINEIINNNYYDTIKSSIKPILKIQFNYDINNYIQNFKINKIINNLKLNRIDDERYYSTTYLNLIKIINN